MAAASGDRPIQNVLAFSRSRDGPRRPPAARARGVLIEDAASIRITHATPFNQHRLAIGRDFLSRLVHMHDFAHDLEHAFLFFVEFVLGDWLIRGGFENSPPIALFELLTGLLRLPLTDVSQPLVPARLPSAAPVRLALNVPPFCFWASRCCSSCRRCSVFSC